MLGSPAGARPRPSGQRCDILSQRFHIAWRAVWSARARGVLLGPGLALDLARLARAGYRLADALGVDIQAANRGIRRDPRRVQRVGQRLLRWLRDHPLPGGVKLGGQRAERLAGPRAQLRQPHAGAADLLLQRLTR